MHSQVAFISKSNSEKTAPKSVDFWRSYRQK